MSAIYFVIGFVVFWAVILFSIALPSFLLFERCLYIWCVVQGSHAAGAIKPEGSRWQLFWWGFRHMPAPSGEETLISRNGQRISRWRGIRDHWHAGMGPEKGKP